MPAKDIRSIVVCVCVFAHDLILSTRSHWLTCFRIRNFVPESDCVCDTVFFVAFWFHKHLYFARCDLIDCMHFHLSTLSSVMCSKRKPAASLLNCLTFYGKFGLDILSLNLLFVSFKVWCFFSCVCMLR